MKNDLFVTAGEVVQDLGISKPFVYKLVRQMNEELEVKVGKNCRKVKLGFKTKREATEWERHFRMKEAADLDMTFGEFVQVYTRDMKPKLKHNTWLTKHILRTKLLPYFKDKKMRDIRLKDIIQWQNEQISYRDEKVKLYAPTYLKTLQSELSALFNHAVRFYELKSNPVVKAGPMRMYCSST